MPLRLVKNKIDHDVVAVLALMLDEARRGEVTGIAFAVSLRNMHYVTGIEGYCCEHPTFARGMVALLSDELAALAHDRDVREIR